MIIVIWMMSIAIGIYCVHLFTFIVITKYQFNTKAILGNHKHNLYAQKQPCKGPVGMTTAAIAGVVAAEAGFLLIFEFALSY